MSLDGPFVSEQHSAAIELLEQSPAPSGYRLIESICGAILDQASALVPAARAAARAR